MTIEEFYKLIQNDFHEIIFHYLLRPSGWETAFNNACDALKTHIISYRGE